MLKTPYKITALDINENLFQQGREVAKKDGLNIEFNKADLNFIEIANESFDIIYAQASLHHIINLEHLFSQLYKGLKQDGRLIILDIIGKSGVIFWKDNVDTAREIVANMPSKYVDKTVNINNIIYPYFEPTDQKGMEGVRQEEIEDQMLRYFKPEKIFKYGSFMRLICTNPQIAPNFDLKNPEDIEYLETLFDTDLRLVAENKLRPTEIFGVFEKRTEIFEIPQAANNIPDLNSLLEKAQVNIEQGNNFDAYLVLHKIFKGEPKNESAQKKYFFLLEQIEIKRKEKKWDVKRSTKNLMLAERLIEDKKYNEAKNKLIDILNSELHHIEAINDLAVVNILENNLEYASELLKVVLSVEPNNEVAVENMNYLYAQFTTQDQADSIFDNKNSDNDVTSAEAKKEEKSCGKNVSFIPSKSNGIICANPFFEFEIDVTGNVVVCCTGWFKHSLGNMKRQTIAEIWNSQVARYVRRKMYKGEWEDICNPNCPTIVEYNKFKKIIPFEELHKNRNVTPQLIEEILAGNDHLATMPTYFKLSDSKVCNLKCKMCGVVKDDNYKDDHDMIKKRSEDIYQYLDKAKTILMCGNGDPFARKDTRELLMNYKNGKSDLKFALITNGLLLPRYWEKVKHQKYESIDISVDAASKDIYEKIRTGGKWENILDTLDLVKKNRDKFESILISMVVMRSNYTEIPAFIDFVESYGFYPMFSRIQGMFEDENIFEMNDQSALNELRKIVTSERIRKRSVPVIWQDLIEFAD
jgi:MoaA/NifB/PqqE/SkfB family radical SAM enzyme/SAM-dependent methyltransferase